jgi:hypothetical protein
MDWPHAVAALADHSHVLVSVIVGCMAVKQLPELIAAFRVAVTRNDARPNEHVKRSNLTGTGSGKGAAKARWHRLVPGRTNRPPRRAADGRQDLST